ITGNKTAERQDRLFTGEIAARISERGGMSGRSQSRLEFAFNLVQFALQILKTLLGLSLVPGEFLLGQRSHQERAGIGIDKILIKIQIGAEHGTVVSREIPATGRH